MRIGFLVCGSPELVSGGFLYDRMLVRELAALGTDVDVDVVWLPWRRYVRALADNLAPLPGPRAGTGRWDLVVEDELAHPSLVLRNARLRAAGIPIVALVHNLRCRPPHARLRALEAAVERRYLRSVDGVLAVCASTLDDVRAALGAAGKDRQVDTAVAHAGRDHVAPGVDDAFIAARAAGAGPLRVLFLAAVAPHKGLHRLLAAAARLPGSSFTIDVVGSLSADAPYVRRIRRMIRRLGLAARVQLHGEQRGEPLAAALRGAHVLALPSDREAYPLAVLEGLGFGLPALVTARGGAAEMMTHGRHGLLLDPDDSDAWTAALAHLAADRAALAAMGQAARARFHEHGTWRDTALAAQRLFETVLRRAHRTGEIRR
jgi:glycosyltransferase involved in cell wall biosynthesis